MLSAHIVFIYILWVNKNMTTHSKKVGRLWRCLINATSVTQINRLSCSVSFSSLASRWENTGESMYFLPFCGPPIRMTAFNMLNKWWFVSTVWQLPSHCFLNSSTNTSGIRVVDVTVTHVASWRHRTGATQGIIPYLRMFVVLHLRPCSLC